MFPIEGEAIANLSMRTRASATSTTMKNIRVDGRSAKNAVVFFGEEEFTDAFDDPMNIPRY